MSDYSFDCNVTTEITVRVEGEWWKPDRDCGEKEGQWEIRVYLGKTDITDLLDSEELSEIQACFLSQAKDEADDLDYRNKWGDD